MLCPFQNQYAIKSHQWQLQKKLRINIKKMEDTVIEVTNPSYNFGLYGDDEP